jgi:hypothetical protein
MTQSLPLQTRSSERLLIYGAAPSRRSSLGLSIRYTSGGWIWRCQIRLRDAAKKCLGLGGNK